MQYTQLALFPESEVATAPRPSCPWVVCLEGPDVETPAVQADELPFDEEPQP